LEGINAVVVGLMAAAAGYLLNGIPYLPTQTSGLLILAVIIGTFLFLKYTRVPPPFIVIACVLLGWVF
jgi:chromate transporter